MSRENVYVTQPLHWNGWLLCCHVRYICSYVNFGIPEVCCKQQNCQVKAKEENEALE